MINVIKTEIDGVVIIEPKVFGDARGYFFESFSERDFNEAMTPILGHGIKFVQDNESMSKSFNKSCFVSFSLSNAFSTGIRQSIPRMSSTMLTPPSFAGA